jgi:hypothetical protein
VMIVFRHCSSLRKAQAARGLRTIFLGSRLMIGVLEGIVVE